MLKTAGKTDAAAAAAKKRKRQCTKFTTIVKQDILRATTASLRRNKYRETDFNPSEGAAGEKKRRVAIAKLIAEKKKHLTTLTGKIHYHDRLALQEEISKLEDDLTLTPPVVVVGAPAADAPPAEECKPQEADICPHCSRLLLHIQNEARLVCESCGESTDYLPCTNAGVPFGEDVEICQHAYERVKHFKTNLQQFSVDAPTIPDWVVYSVHRGYARLHVKSVHEVRATPVKEVLKSLGLSDYRNYSSRITNRLNGVPTALFQPEEIKELLNMFREVQPIFPYVKTCSRRNFLNTNYLLNKFCRIKGWKDRAKTFPLMKERKVASKFDGLRNSGPLQFDVAPCACHGARE